MTQLRLPIIAMAFPTLLIALLVALLLAGERWPRLGDFTKRRPAVMVAVIMGTATGLLVFVLIPDPISLILAPLILGFLVLVGWAVQRAREYLGS